jgi:hypothetical protein
MIKLPAGQLTDFCYEYAPSISIALIITYYLVFHFLKSAYRWFERLKDDYYLVGQALQNVDE